MLIRRMIAPGVVLALGLPLSAQAASDADWKQLHDEIQQMKQTYEARIQALEARLKDAETAAGQAKAKADQAEAKADQAATAPPPTTPASANAFNPAVSLILSGIYGNLSQDPSKYALTGFIPQGNGVAPGSRGLSLSESELGINANIDPYFRGSFAMAVDENNQVSVEEAYVQTLGLSHGLTVKAGRFLSAVGYLNEQHAHVWDFADEPLVYRAFLGTQLKDDGVQLRWIAPTETFVELGGELARGRNAPGSNRDKNGAGAATLFAHAGGDIGDSNSWRVGVSTLRTSPQDAQSLATDLAGNQVTDSFTGDTRLWGTDFVWKWAPHGDPTYRNFKLQGEYFHRRNSGNLTYNVADLAGVAGALTTSAYSADQSGWYLQGVYQFMPYWRFGLRYDRLNGGTVGYGANDANLPVYGYDPTRSTAMVDYSPSEFSRIRLQFAQDKSRQGVTDNQMFLQYQMSLGAHGAHIF